MGHESSEWTGVEPARKSDLDKRIRTVLPIAVGLTVGNIARGPTHEALGWWSILVCMLVAAVVALVADYFVLAWQRRHNSA